MTAYTVTTEAERLQSLFEHSDIDLDEVVHRAVSSIIENSILWLSFSDGSEWPIPQPWCIEDRTA